jgi:ribosomal protein S18 acetylase RimI-like enzyme
MDLTIEELSLSAWPALQTIVYDGWILRFAEGYTKRSNSANPLYASTRPVLEKVEACEGLYAGQGLPCVFKLLGLGAHGELDALLDRRGYERLDETSVRLLDLGSRFGGESGGIEAREGFGEEWLEGFCRASRIEGKKGIVARLLGNVMAGTVVVSKRVGGELVGFGYGAIDRGFVGIFDIVVREDQRRRGFGEEIVRAILGGAEARGARRAYLQVIVGNERAERLYDKLGFEEAYRYWYRRK